MLMVQNLIRFINFKNKMPGVAGTSQIKWNFTKFLISKNGDIVKRFSPQTEANEIELSIIELL